MNEHSQINSNQYWDSRFSEDWESFEGPKQSRFFSRLALANLPGWLIREIKREKLSVVDWGCAQGDGTNEWANLIDIDQLTGVDFSGIAIATAKERYPEMRFINQNWLDENVNDPISYDLVFSSNTLEHFHQPFDVLKSLSRYARKAIILALPYKELDRIDEHFYSFLPDNIPVQLPNGFCLIWSKVIDCTEMPNTLWDGDQIFLVYAQPEWLSQLSLSLSEIVLEQTDNVSEIARLSDSLSVSDQRIADASLDAAMQAKQVMQAMEAMQAKQISELELALQQRGHQLEDLSQNLAQRDQVIHDLNSKLAEISRANDDAKENLSKAHEENQQLSFRFNRLNDQAMALSNWANQINSTPIRYGLKKFLLNLARSTFGALPINTGLKYKLRNWIRKSQSVVAATSTGNTTDVIAGPTNPVHFDQNQERDVLFFSVIDWHFRTQRPQQLAMGFAKAGARVFYFSNHFIDSETPGYAIEPLDGSSSIFQVKLHIKGAPAIYFEPPTMQAEAMLKQSFIRFALDYSVISSVVMIEHAYWYGLVRSLPNALISYDCMDHHEGFGNVPEKLINIEKDMLQQCDLVVVTSSWLKDFAQDYSTSIAVIRNACDFGHFSIRPSEIYSDSQGRKIIGYYGAIAEWFDLDIVAKVAGTNPDKLVLLVGDDTVNAKAKLSRFSNIDFVGEVPYQNLPFYLYAFDVCILPFKVIPLTLATNPVKVYEYLAAGKPVVSIDLPEIAQFGHTVQCAKSADEFVALINQELGYDAEQIEQRKKFAAQQTWGKRIVEIRDAVAGIQWPKISVVVLTYNNLDLTKQCLNSLIDVSDYPNFEIIVVDNASSDETPQYLREFALLHPACKIILNEKNLGFAAGNNVGLAVATGDYLVLLNNDTVVTRGWALSLMRHLQFDQSIGLVGPVTNNIGNEARIEMKYSDLQDMPLEAFHRTVNKMGQKIAIKNVAFFCVMMPRSTYEKCGPLCEDYGLGFFEDDDYCRQVESVGLQIVCARDVFVHHQLSASFNKLPSKSRQELMARNKAIYESKWGTWEPHVYQKEAN
ncbi:GT2 family glycosyltransferase/glycosyltransferase involved in cell wall biosynthesis [Oxalobacteraceae bacterium GrIS 2.11]